MAKIKAHGDVVGTIDYITMTKRYMSDGAILKNHGFGWKLAGKLKPGLTPAEAYSRAAAAHRESLASRPAAAEYRRQLHSITGSKEKRALLASTIDLMPDDPDGVWSMCCDDYRTNIDADLDDIAQLCRAYQAALREAEYFKAGKL